jgi:hypothetical protein
MEVRESIDLGDGHLIEIGGATWDTEATSVRNRYPTSTGGFSPRSSSEIPLHDFEPMMVVIAARDLLDVASTARILAALAESIARRTRT